MAGPPKKIQELLDRAGMTLNIPEEFTETEIIENNHMSYDYALKHPTDRFEVRYSIHPLDEMIKEYEERERNKKEGDFNLHPNGLYPSAAMAVAFNISGKMANIGPFDDGAVKREYYADKGCTTSVEPREGFANGYKLCAMIVIQKDNLAIGYMFFLADDMKTLIEGLSKTGYSLKFKPE